MCDDGHDYDVLINVGRNHEGEFAWTAADTLLCQSCFSPSFKETRDFLKCLYTLVPFFLQPIWLDQSGVLVLIIVELPMNGLR